MKNLFSLLVVLFLVIVAVPSVASIYADEIQPIVVYGRISAYTGPSRDPYPVRIPMADLYVKAYRYDPAAPYRDPVLLAETRTDILGNYVLKIKWNVTASGERLSYVFINAYSINTNYFLKTERVWISDGITMYEENFNNPSLYRTLYEGRFVTITGKVVNERMDPVAGAGVLIENVNDPSAPYAIYGIEPTPIITNEAGLFRVQLGWSQITEPDRIDDGHIRITAKTNDSIGRTEDILPTATSVPLSYDSPTWNTDEYNAFIFMHRR